MQILSHLFDSVSNLLLTYKYYNLKFQKIDIYKLKGKNIVLISWEVGIISHVYARNVEIFQK